jgi:hypothetical protein
VLNDVAPFTSNYDGHDYYVRKNDTNVNKSKAADYLAKLNDKVNTIVDYAHKQHIPDKNTADRLAYRWNRCELKEIDSHEKSAAYTLNKSKEIRLCIRNANGFENENTSMFVLLHELAHVMSISYGHEDEFKHNFDFITNLASNMGLYKPEDFFNSPKTYCGTEINSTPCAGNSCSFGTLLRHPSHTLPIDHQSNAWAPPSNY